MTLKQFLTLAVILVCLRVCLSAAPHPYAPAQNGAEVLIAQNGKAKLDVVIPYNANPSTRALAAELASYLQRIAGAPFLVRTGNASSGIILGTIGDFPEPTLQPALEIRNTFDGREALVIRTEPGRVLLIGATELGISHAAFRFLEMLGCRWFFPAPEWEVIPTQSTLRFSADHAERPAILARRIWYGWGHFPDTPKQTNRPSASQAYRDWARRNRMAGSFAVNAGHAWEAIVANNRQKFEEHSNYLALVKGIRNGPQLCVSEPGVRQLAIEHALNFFRKNPAADMVSMETADGNGQCECANCLKLGSISDRVFGLANEVARAVQTNFPGKYVGMYAYNEHSEPPSIPLEPNVYVQLTAGFITGRYTLDELIEIWPRLCKSMGMYEYFSVWLWDFDRLPGGSAANVSHLQNRIQLYASKGATSIDGESGNNWGPHGRGYYIANRLMWDPQADMKALLADFYEKAFGAGAPAMQRYYERLDPGTKPLMSRHLLAQAFRDIAEATQRTRDRPDIQARLDHLKQYLRYVHLRWMLDREKDKSKQKELTLATLTHAYRTRSSFMNHWEAMRQEWTPRAAKSFDDPSWSSRSKTKQPWAVETAYTRAETERLFQEGLAYFQLQRAEEKMFSTNLVAVAFTNAPLVVSKQAYQGAVRYALCSRDGTPLQLEVTAGTIAWYRDRADARYTLSDEAGLKLSDSRLRLDGEAQKVQLAVPSAGIYYLDFDDSAAGWSLKVGTNTPVSIVLRRDRGYSHAGHMQQMYFYVPRGTQTIDYYWSGGPHRVHGPDGKLVQEVTANGEFVSIPVADGMDRQPWSFTQLALGHLWFFNVPNQLAASPNALLVPRDVAEADGLILK